MSKKDNLRREQALEYHASGRPGKIEVVPTKEAKTQKDLSLAYSPGVAIPCTEIVNNPSDVYKYTAKGNLVGVITNGTAVLGLGNIGPLASKPVMEGKAVLFKIFADIDVFDIEINETDPDKFIEIVKSLEPTFGGINLEDIKAPECFYIEQRLRDEMNIPVMHDDQHGTAIISSAALLNALELQKKKIEKAKFVVNGAGAAAMACIKLYVALGARYENFTLFDKDGVLHQGRTDLGADRKPFAIKSDKMTLPEAMKSADVFLGLSVGNVVSKEMIASMPKNPVVFALANPDPEIDPAIARKYAAVVATGRSDQPNQINNVLAFPGIFRGLLDGRITKITDKMLVAAADAISSCVTSDQLNANFIVPSVFDTQVVTKVADAVKLAGRV